jgi:pimeloyl-ACP methyl ester carboxylesterase
MAADRSVSVNGARIHYRVEGSGPPVLLIHGLGAFLESWNWTVPALRDHYTTIAFDFPGFGLSDPLDDAYTPQGAAAFTLAFMDALAVRQAALVGSSLGGTIAALAAGSAPDRCSALVLIAPAGFDVDATLMARLATLPLVGELFIGAIRWAPRMGVWNAFVKRGQIPQPLIATTGRYFKLGLAGRSCLRALRATVGLGGVRPEIVAEVRAAASRVTAPTLIVWGTRDRVVPPGHAAVAARAIPGATIRLFEGAGHVPYIEEPDAFNAALLEFLCRIKEPVGART